MGKAANPDELAPEVKIDPEVASDVDGDGVLDINPDKAHETMFDLVTLDHALRDHGLSVAALLRTVADKSFGIRV